MKKVLLIFLSLILFSRAGLSVGHRYEEIS